MEKEKVHKELTDYLKQLRYQFLRIESIDSQLRIIAEWEAPEKVKTLHDNSLFFWLVQFSFTNTMLLELDKLIGLDREKEAGKKERCLEDWLKKAFEHAKQLKPQHYNRETNKRELLKETKYKEIIRDDQDRLEKKRKLILELRKNRDKIIAHSDPKNYEKSKANRKIMEIYSKSRELIDLCADILRKHEYHLFADEGDPALMKIASLTDVGTILKHLRGFKRVLGDKNIIEAGIAPKLYFHDDYSGSIPQKDKTD